MPKKIVDETLKFDVIINGDKAQKEYGQLERAKKKLIDANTDLEKQAKKLEKANKQNTAEYVALRKEIESNNKTIAKNEGRLQELTKEIGVNNLSMRQLGREARKLNGIMANLDPNSQEWAAYNTQLQSIKGRMANLRQEMRPVAESMEEQLGAVDALTAGFGQFFNGLRSGDLGAARAGLNAVTTSISGATRASLAFAATPIGATIAVLAGIGFAAKEWFNYNQEVKDAVILTQQITGLQGAQADAARLQAQAISETFNTDFTETLRTASILSKQFNISFSEALEEINAGLVQGQAVNDEYFDSLKEYPTFFASAGFSATEFRKTIEQGYDLGIYQDKLPDAIKEVDLSLREQTKATTEALQNAFGAAFTESILSRIRTGEITTKQALKEISAEADKTGLNVQQNAQLTADLFRGAGEDAGGAIVVLNAFNKSLGNNAEVLTPLEQQLKRVSDANLELAKAQDEALKNDNYVAFSNDLKVFWAQVKTQFFKGVSFITDNLAKAEEYVVSFLMQGVTTFQMLPTVAQTAFNQLKTEVWDVVQTFNGLSTVIENLFDFNFDAAKTAFTDFKANFKKEVADVAGVANSAYDVIKKGRQLTAENTAAYFQNRRAAANEQTNSAGIPVSQNNSSTGGSTADSSQLAPEDKAKLDSKKRLYTMLDALEAERQIQDQLKKLDKDQRAQEEEVLRIEQKFQKLTEEAQGEQELITRLEAEKQAQLQEVRDKYAEEQLAKDKATKQKLKEFQNELTEELIASEEALTNAKQQAAAQGIAIMRNLVGENTALGKALFVIEKGIAIANVTTNAAKASAAIIAATNTAVMQSVAMSPLTGGQPMAGVAIAAGAKSLAANKIGAATSIAAIAAEGIAGFQDGLYPMMRKDGKTFNTRFGGSPNTQIVSAPTHFIAGEVKPEMIIDGDTFRKMDPSVTGYILSLAGKVPGYQNGMYPKNNEQSQAVLKQLTGAVAMLTERLNMPIEAQVNYGVENSLKQQEFDKKIKTTRNNAKIN